MSPFPAQPILKLKAVKIHQFNSCGNNCHVLANPTMSMAVSSVLKGLSVTIRFRNTFIFISRELLEVLSPKVFLFEVFETLAVGDN